MTKASMLFLTASMMIAASLSPSYAQSNTPDGDVAACADDKCDDEIRTLHRMARFGSFEAMTLLSMVYATGDGRDADPEKALSYLQRAVSYRHPTAVFLLSEWYREGLVVTQDLQKAHTLLTQAVELKHTPAQYKKALLLLQQPDEADIATGVELLEQASDKRLLDAMFLLARLKQQGAYTELDLEGAAQLFKNLVLSGHEESRPYLKETIAILTPKPEAAELVADLQQSYDMEVIQVFGRDFKPDNILSTVVTQLNNTGIYTRGSLNRIRTMQCDGRNGCYTMKPKRGDRDLKQTLTGQP
ncbi:tetratricopeptide repeat protein [Arsukibacterium sp.]|uniref:tetratricopeptide repeat protein n=1 Tax=Arsukibacterium sp. TaxID=1977258 RepID=UPI001BD65838|nr:tetratricopeptide repeat protein [Arsukibacterium sp.]